MIYSNNFAKLTEQTLLIELVFFYYSRCFGHVILGRQKLLISAVSFIMPKVSYEIYLFYLIKI